MDSKTVTTIVVIVILIIIGVLIYNYYGQDTEFNGENATTTDGLFDDGIFGTTTDNGGIFDGNSATTATTGEEI